MTIRKKWRGLAAGLVLSIATIGAVSTVSSTPSQAADVGFGIVVNDHDHHHRGWEARREAEWRHEHYRREREHARHVAWREHEWRQHQRFERDHDRW